MNVRFMKKLLLFLLVLLFLMMLLLFFLMAKGDSQDGNSSAGNDTVGTEASNENSDPDQQGSDSSKKDDQKENSDSGENDSLTEDEKLEKQASDILEKMTLEEKVAQLFFVTPEGITGVDVATAAGETTKNAISRYPVGGIIYFAQNIYSEDQIRSMIRNTQSYSEIPLFIGVDEEGGSLVARIANNPAFPVQKFPNMIEIGATGDSSKAYEVGSTIASYLKDYGFNLDFAPDADVLTNPANTAIGNRSFGGDPDLVADMVAEAVKGFQENQVSSVIKHFPGHGGTDTDSHNGAAVVNRSLDELRSAEFLPFQAGIEAGADLVMVGHLQVPQVISDDTPSSLSSEMITDILRGELGYQGIVITDSLSMGAVTEYYTPAEAAVKCIQAGGDMLLMPQNFEQAYQGVLSAVENQTITEERLNESVLRILKVKCKNLYD